MLTFGRNFANYNPPLNAFHNRFDANYGCPHFVCFKHEEWRLPTLFACITQCPNSKLSTFYIKQLFRIRWTVMFAEMFYHQTFYIKQREKRTSFFHVKKADDYKNGWRNAFRYLFLKCLVTNISWVVKFLIAWFYRIQLLSRPLWLIENQNKHFLWHNWMVQYAVFYTLKKFPKKILCGNLYMANIV